MSEIAAYTFLPWLRQGLANQISGQSGQRATVSVALTLRGERVDGSGTDNAPPIQRDVEIYGPGDVIGIEPRAIIKTDPHNGLTNFEPNYLPYIDFYDEDFAWRYSPVAASGHRLMPWLALIVLKQDELKEGGNTQGRPLPYIATTSSTKLPPPEQLWAWAHVHVNKNLIGTEFRSDNADAIQTELARELDGNPDLGYCRLLCPRHLEPNTSYHALLVPTYDSGRRAGCGMDPTGAASFDAPAWPSGTVPVGHELPYYHRFYFRTGSVGDFEYLVRLLKPQPIDSRVGIRDMDVQKPGANIRGIVDAALATEDKKLGGLLKLGGALRIPDASYTPEELALVEKYRKWATLNGTQAYPHAFQKDLAAFINLSDAYAAQSALQANSAAAITEEQVATDPGTEHDIGQNPDPLITAPLYGQWHALTQRLLTDRDGNDLTPNDNWVHELNLDPRFRVPAGFGTNVVQDNQEDYMQAAWSQVGEVLESNKRIRHGQLATAVSTAWYERYLKPTHAQAPQQWLMLSAPLHARVLTSSPRLEAGRTVVRKATVRRAVDDSRLPRATLSMGMRKQLRPRGPLVKRLPFDARITPQNLVARLNEGEVSAAPPRIDPPALDAHEDIANALSSSVPEFFANNRWLRRLPLLLALLLVLALLLLRVSISAWGVGVVAVVALLALERMLSTWAMRLEGASTVLPARQSPSAVDDWPKSPDFRVSTGGEVVRPSFGGNDSPEAQRFKAASKDAYALVQTSLAASKHVSKPMLDLEATGAVLLEALAPSLTIPRWVYASVKIPGRIQAEQSETFVEAMAYPEIDLPMYKPLVDRSSELFLPNIDRIAQNSISLLETNQQFIEAYMVGLNHEFARELLWREYPTDQRGSYFRQFWEARGFHDPENAELSPEELKERLRDIPPIHLWPKASKLGDHDQREEAGDKEEEVVLVIRGELLKKYPNAVIYAQRAVWKDKDGKPIVPPSDKAIDPAKERDLHPLSAAEQANPPRTLIKTPLYEAKVDPDIYFFGFDLTVCTAKGGTGKQSVPVDDFCSGQGIAWDDPGWFFVIKERPGEPRFGLDIGDAPNVDAQGRIEVWNDLAWHDVTPAVAEGQFLQLTAGTSTITANQPLESDDDEKAEQKAEDQNIVLHKDMSSAELAYILYQVPVLVAVHASEMLQNT